MAITQSLCNSFKAELAAGIHDFSSGGDTFKIALFDSSASLSSATTAYSATNEVSGTGYTAGGATLTNVSPVLSGATAILDFADVSWPGATITARGALIYNSSKSNRAVAVLDFGSDRISTASTFLIQMPVADAANAIIRIT